MAYAPSCCTLWICHCYLSVTEAPHNTGLGEMSSCSFYVLRGLPGQQGWRNEVKTRMILSFFIHAVPDSVRLQSVTSGRERRPGLIGQQKCEVVLNHSRWAVELEWRIVAWFPAWCGWAEQQKLVSFWFRPEIGQNDFCLQLPSPQEHCKSPQANCMAMALLWQAALSTRMSQRNH